MAYRLGGMLPVALTPSAVHCPWVQTAHVVVREEETLVGLGDLASPEVCAASAARGAAAVMRAALLVACALPSSTRCPARPLCPLQVVLAGLGLTVIASLHYRQVPGSIIVGIFLTAIGCAPPAAACHGWAALRRRLCIRTPALPCCLQLLLCQVRVAP